MKFPKPWHIKGLKVKNSPLHGKGLFAAKPIAEGEELGQCAWKPTKKPGLYTLSLEQGDVDITCKLRYINHGAKPNASYFDDLSVVALRDIAPGEEILHHYGDEWD